MKCKYCEAELEEGVTVCPSCGGQQLEQEQPVSEPPVPVCSEQEQPVIEEPLPQQPPIAQPPKAKVKVWQVVVGAVASLIVLAALAIVLLTAFGVDLRPAPNDIHKKDTYTVSDDKAIKKADKVVAELNGYQLTNSMLQMFYRMQIVEFLNTNSEYLSYMNLDLDKPLWEQTCSEDETLTWEQYFMNLALETSRNYLTVYMMAMEEGYKPSQDLEKSLQELPQTMVELAEEEGFANADELIADRFGAGCTVVDYENYCRIYYISAEYINITPTAQQLEDYYTANEALFQQYGIGKDSGNMVNVRHILVCPEGGTMDEETSAVTYSDEEWAACLAKAEGILVDWENGEATEESFAALANEKSEDGGSNTNGGLYAGITAETGFVEPFLNWCMDETRNVGDTGIVQTEYGYHIMYFAFSQPQWEYYANTYFLSEYTNQKIEEGRAKWPMEVTYKNIFLAELDFS